MGCGRDDWSHIEMKTDNEIKLGINDALKEEGFYRKSTTWYREMNETLLVVNLQKSNFGDIFYINLAIEVKTLPAYPGSKPPQKAHQCHIQVRIDSVEPAEDEQIKRLLNLEDATIPSIDRRRGIKQAVVRIALPLLTQCSTIDGIRIAYSQGKLEHAAIFKSVRDEILSEL